MANRPEAEVTIDATLVKRLLEQQVPELADQPITELARGWDNTNFRVGTKHVARLPHREAAAELILHEQAHLSRLAERIELAIPVPIHHGTPSGDYPWHWSVTPWFDGEIAARANLADPAVSARSLGRFFAQVHRPAPPEAPANPFRGVPLQERADLFARQINRLETNHDKSRMVDVFAEALDAPVATERVWLHGDLHTRNIIVNDGDLAAVIDWGDVTSGDRATDLAAAFMLVPDHLADVARVVGADEAAWTRARGWAAHFGLVYLINGDDDPIQSGIGARLLDTLVGPAR